MDTMHKAGMSYVQFIAGTISEFEGQEGLVAVRCDSTSQTFVRITKPLAVLQEACRRSTGIRNIIVAIYSVTVGTLDCTLLSLVCRFWKAQIDCVPGCSLTTPNLNSSGN